MKLTKLDAELLWKLGDTNVFESGCPTVAEAQGLMFLCPICFVKNGGLEGTHRIICWFKDRGVPDTMGPLPARWVPAGTTLADISLHPSVAVPGGCRWHGNIFNGEIA